MNPATTNLGKIFPFIRPKQFYVAFASKSQYASLVTIMHCYEMERLLWIGVCFCRDFFCYDQERSGAERRLWTTKSGLQVIKTEGTPRLNLMWLALLWRILTHVNQEINLFFFLGVFSENTPSIFVFEENLSMYSLSALDRGRRGWVTNLYTSCLFHNVF